MIGRLQHWWRRLCGEYVRTPKGGDDMTRAWDY